MSICTKCGREAFLWSVNPAGIEGLPEWVKSISSVGVGLCFDCVPAGIRARIEEERKRNGR